MFLGIIPTLSKKGFFARYYGGCKLYDSLDDRPGASVYPISLAVSLILQVSLYCFKKMQQRKLTISLIGKTPSYFQRLTSTVHSGLNNLYSSSAFGELILKKIKC